MTGEPVQGRQSIPALESARQKSLVPKAAPCEQSSFSEAAFGRADSSALSWDLSVVRSDYRVNYAQTCAKRMISTMLRSMTAYGRSSLKTDSGDFLCELRSVNHRYLDVSVRLPECLRQIEPAIRENVTKVLHRGKIDISIKLTQSSTTNQTFSLNEDLLTQLSLAADKVKLLSGSSADVDPVRLMQWPGVLTASVDFQESQVEDALSVFESALGDFLAARSREGAQISELLQGKGAELENLVLEVRKLAPSILEKQRAKLDLKLAQIDIEYDQSRMEQELIYSALRIDINEELDRLDAHCSELSNILNRTDPVGRRLDFLMQEFNREANTVNSKSIDLGTSNAALEIKVLVEQMREQVQNIE